MCLIFSRIPSENFLTLRRIERNVIINVKKVFMRSTCCSCQILVDLNILATFSKKFSSSSCSIRMTRVSCFLILKTKLVAPTLPGSSYVPSSFWLVRRNFQGSNFMKNCLLGVELFHADGPTD